MPDSIDVRSPSRMTGLEPPVSEAALVSLALRDPRAFAPLYARYLDPIYRYCFRRLGRREAAEDATSRVFEKALAGLHGFRGGSFQAWLFSIAHHVVIDDVRSRRPVLPLTAADRVQDSEPSPEDRVLAGEYRRTVDGLLASLSPDQREVVELRLSGLSGREIAAALDRSHAWVRTTQARALARLRNIAPETAGTNGWRDV